MTNEQIPPDLRLIAEQLDELGASHRAAAPQDLEERIFERVMPSMADQTEAPAPLAFPRALKHWRLAAMLTVAAGATIIVAWTLSPATQQPIEADTSLAEIESEIDDFLAITASWEDFDENTTESAGDLASGFWGPDEDEDLLSEDTL